MHGPPRVAGLGCDAQRFVAAEVEGELHRHGFRVERSGVEPGEEAAPAAASAARLQPQRPPVDGHPGIGAKAARIADPEAQLGAVHLHLPRLDPGPDKVRRKSETRLARNAGVIDDRLVDRPLADLGPDVGRQVDRFRRESQLADHVAAAGHALPVLDHGFGRRRAIGNDEDRPRHRLGSAPALRDRGGGFVRLRFAVIDQQPHREERNGQGKAHDDRQEQLEPRCASAVDVEHAPLLPHETGESL